MLGQFTKMKSLVVPREGQLICCLCLYHQLAVVDQLSPSQQAALLLDPNSPAFEDEAIVREVLTSLTQSQDDGELEDFFQEFANISKQVTTCFDGYPRP